MKSANSYKSFIATVTTCWPRSKKPSWMGFSKSIQRKRWNLRSPAYGEVEHIAIFDEAQRSWTHKRLSDYLKRGGTYGNKLKVPNFPYSEAAFLIWSLDQREDWATIVCLVGGGQEINTEGAGISEWIKALNEKFPHWRIYISDKLTEAEYAEGRVNELLAGNDKVTFSPGLSSGSKFAFVHGWEPVCLCALLTFFQSGYHRLV